jgi:hypothetical protein
MGGSKLLLAALYPVCPCPDTLKIQKSAIGTVGGIQLGLTKVKLVISQWAKPTGHPLGRKAIDITSLVRGV